MYPYVYIVVLRAPLSLCSSFLAKLKDPPLIPVYKPLDYVEALAQIYTAIEAAPNDEKPTLYLHQSFVFRGMDEMHDSIQHRSMRRLFTLRG